LVVQKHLKGLFSIRKITHYPLAEAAGYVLAIFGTAKPSQKPLAWFLECKISQYIAGSLAPKKFAKFIIRKKRFMSGFCKGGREYRV
jgi:hypothetical protein